MYVIDIVYRISRALTSRISRRFTFGAKCCTMRETHEMERNMKYTTVLLDADMTLWDFNASERCALRDVTGSLGLELTPDMEA